MTVRLHPHAVIRLKERGCMRSEVEYTVKHGARSPAKFGRTRFTHAFAYNRKWKGKLYARKIVEAYAVDQGADDWLVITVVTKYI